MQVRVKHLKTKDYINSSNNERTVIKIISDVIETNFVSIQA